MAKRAKYGDSKRCAATARRCAETGVVAELLRGLDKLADHYAETAFCLRGYVGDGGKARGRRLDAGVKALRAVIRAIEWPTDARLRDVRTTAQALHKAHKVRKVTRA